MTTTRLPYEDYYLTIKRARNSEWQKEWENINSLLNYIKSCIEQWESAHNICRLHDVTLNRLRIGHTRLTYRQLMLKTANIQLAETYHAETRES